MRGDIVDTVERLAAGVDEMARELLVLDPIAAVGAIKANAAFGDTHEAVVGAVEVLE